MSDISVLLLEYALKTVKPATPMTNDQWRDQRNAASLRQHAVCPTFIVTESFINK